MKIVADAQLAGVEAAFAGLGELRLVDGRQLSADTLQGADALLVRSVTPVTAELLAGTQIRFVGTATSGVDHIDTDYLARQDITLADAKGANANAVVDYCMAAMAYVFSQRPGWAEDICVGLVGYGHIGRAMADRLQKLGIDTRVCDPPLAASGTAANAFVSLKEIGSCDLVSLHVPLTKTGAHATAGMIDGAFLGALPQGAVLVNSCRGGVVNEAALMDVLNGGAEISYIADVWQGEPEPEPRVVAAATLATPHIAGYSRRAKWLATRRLREAFIHRFRLDGNESADVNDDEESPALAVDSSDPWQILLQALPLHRLSNEFKQAVSAGDGTSAFTGMRRQLLQRREFCEIKLAGEFPDAAVRQALTAHGFRFS